MMDVLFLLIRACIAFTLFTFIAGAFVFVLGKLEDWSRS